jgi:hypothetical protein
MATRRVIKGVLGNFLGTYTSRYSDRDGYWLFGFLVGDFDKLHIDLLTPTGTEPDTPLGTAIRLANEKFTDQMLKSALSHSQIHSAWLTIRQSTSSATGTVNGHTCTGCHFVFLVEAVMEGGRHYRREQTVFLARHNPEVELRSTLRN